MKLEQLRKNYQLIDIFVRLCKIPSPSLAENDVAEEILAFFRENNISAEYDSYKNIIARIPGSGRLRDAPSLLLSAHMDVVGNADPVNIRLSCDGKYIETDKTRTLGADNKAGIAAIMDFASGLGKFEHVPVEITFTRDEEKGMTGIRSLDSSKLRSKYAIVIDGGHLGELDTEGAGFTNVYINISGGRGGHSGLNINEADRISAINILSGIICRIPQGVFKSDPEKGTITSINAGFCRGGEVETGFLNVIASQAQVAYSIRSSEPENEKKLIDLITSVVNDFQEKYRGLLHFELEIKPHLQPFVRSDDNFLANTILEAAKILNIKCCPASFHAGAETHILANEKKNFGGETFEPVIIGVADLYNIHSSDEKIDWKSFLQGRKWLEEIIKQYGNKTCPLGKTE